MRVAYADPPYIGQAKRHYGQFGGSEVDHVALIRRLERDYPDGWALSLSSASLFEMVFVLVEAKLRDEGQIQLGPHISPIAWAAMLRDLLPELLPEGVRIAAWVKPFCSFKPGVNPAYAWEPVIWRGGRQKRDRREPTVRDWIATPITLKRGMPGAKPDAFCYWLFDLLGLQPSDTLDDLFPGSRAVSQAWQRWQLQMWTVAE